MRFGMLVPIWIGMMLIGCIGTPQNPNQINYNNGTVYYLQSPASTQPARLDGVTQIRLDRDYVTVETHGGEHIIPRDRFIQSSP